MDWISKETLKLLGVLTAAGIAGLESSDHLILYSFPGIKDI